MAEIALNNEIKTFVQDVFKIQESEELDFELAFHLVALHNGFKFANTNQHYQELIKRGYLTTSVYERIHNLIHNISVHLIDGHRAPILTKETGTLVHELLDIFLAGKKASDFQKLLSYNSNPILIMFFFLFLEIFPSSDRENNANWERYFGSEYTGVTLRRVSKGTVNKFEKVYKTKDMGVFLLATVLFIKSSYSAQNNNYYVKNLEKFFNEYEDYYAMAQDKMHTSVRTVVKTQTGADPKFRVV